MGRDLTKRYLSVFETHRVTQPLSFVRDVYATGKWRELSSFIVWESLHRLRLFPVHGYLTFTDSKPLALKTEDFTDAGFNDRVGEFFAGLGLRATACHQNWKLVYLRGGGGILGCRYPNDNELYESNDGRTINLLHSFPARIKAIFISGAQTVFVCVKGAVYRRAANAASFDRVLDLVRSPPT